METKIRLEPLDAVYMDTIREWRNNTSGVLRTTLLLTYEQQEDFYKKIVCNRNSNCRYFAIKKTIRNNCAEISLIGMCGLENIEWENGLAEISLILGPNYVGKGYGKESLFLILNEGFNVLRLNTIYGECYYSNPNLGFWRKQIKKYNGYDCQLLDRKYFKGKYYNSLYFSFNKELFNKSLERKD
jgi:RimJ/RimL family protein N-acetyltransferase